jgi:hypothetical protein
VLCIPGSRRSQPNANAVVVPHRLGEAINNDEASELDRLADSNVVDGVRNTRAESCGNTFPMDFELHFRSSSVDEDQMLHIGQSRIS